MTERFWSQESSALCLIASPFRIRAPCDTLPGSWGLFPRAGPCPDSCMHAGVLLQTPKSLDRDLVALADLEPTEA